MPADLAAAVVLGMFCARLMRHQQTPAPIERLNARHRCCQIARRYRSSEFLPLKSFLGGWRVWCSSMVPRRSSRSC